MSSGDMKAQNHIKLILSSTATNIENEWKKSASFYSTKMKALEKKISALNGCEKKPQSNN